MIHACPHHAGRPPEKQHELQCIRPTPSNYLRELPRLPRAPRLVVPSSRRRLSEASSTRTSSPAASSAADISRLLLAARDGQSQVRAACAKDSCCDLNTVPILDMFMRLACCLTMTMRTWIKGGGGDNKPPSPKTTFAILSLRPRRGGGFYYLQVFITRSIVGH